MQGVHPVVLTRFDLIELVLQLSGELHVQQVGEILDQQAGDGDAEFGGQELALLVRHVLPSAQRTEDGSVGARPPDAEFFQFTDQRSLGVTRRRLCEMLIGYQFAGLHLLAFL